MNELRPLVDIAVANNSEPECTLDILVFIRAASKRGLIDPDAAIGRAVVKTDSLKIVKVSVLIAFDDLEKALAHPEIKTALIVTAGWPDPSVYKIFGFAISGHLETLLCLDAAFAPKYHRMILHFLSACHARHRLPIPLLRKLNF
jgi:hypothetical protein